MDLSQTTYSSCPLCGAEQFAPVVRARDFTVSGREFEIEQCSSCHLRFTQNIPDASSISTYYKSDSYVSHSDTNRGLINRVYHLVRKRSLNNKRRLIEKITGMHKGDLLDLGAGTGAFVQFMHLAGWKAIGMEPDDGARERARKMNGVDLLPVSEFMNQRKESFDAITLWHVLEHVHDLHGYLDQLKLLLRPNGKIFIAVPNYLSYDADYYKKYWAAYDVPRHLYHFSPDAMKALLRKHDLRLLQTKPMWFDAFYISLLSEKYKGGAAQWMKGLYRGFLSNVQALFKNEKSSSLIYIVGK
jgi:2-polyprenyl-3-methyl-5-hydroxy-6-metoxy-1,4-benzoquinol methylase